MRKCALSMLSFLLAILMLLPGFVACVGNITTDDSTSIPSSDTIETDSSESSSNGGDKETEPEDDIELEGIFGDSIAYSNKLVNGVQSYYTESSRDNYKIENMNMDLLYSLSDTKKVSAITNKNGGVYVSDTMDVYVLMENGEKIFASDSAKKIRPNIYRLGYYYYDVHFLENDFKGSVDESGASSLKIDPAIFSHKSAGIGNLKIRNGEITARIVGSDPYIVSVGGEDQFTFSADEYNAIRFNVKTTSTNSVQVYYVSGGDTRHTDGKKVSINVNPDGEYHTYTILLNEGSGFEGDISKIRIDFEGFETDEIVYIKDIELLKAESSGPSALYFDRTFHTYSDKLHQELHFMATKKVTGIKEFGMVTEISVDTVEKLIVKDASGTKNTLDGVDWNTAEYIGFDIKDVGIFGYILPNHKDAGKMTVELVGDKYVVTQTFCPEGGTIEPINAKETFTDNDFFTGNRIYTDATHSFDNFLIEAEWERNPFNAISSDRFVEYEAFKGAYLFSIMGTGFNPPFFYENNFHYTVSAKMRSDVDRPIYIRTSTTSGCLESAVVLDQNNMVLPIPTEVSKNFGGEDEEPIFNSGDRTYGETIFPLILSAGERLEFTVINLYQNWGITPLKQLSSIQYFWPYYHLSVGTTETSCISPWYGAHDLWTLPDFRSQSMPYWFELEQDMGYSNQPQHTHAGLQYFLQYTDADGIYNATENISNVIDSSGPLYVDVDMTYISDDGKIKVSYSHVEMPQEDELRAYYEIKYEILDEVTIKDFANDFSFYSFEGYAGYYQDMGYWAENGDNDGIVYKKTNGDNNPEMLVLGNDCPYVSLYNLKTADNSSWRFNNANLGFVIHSSDIVIDGVKRNDNFVLVGQEYVYSLSMDIGEVTLKPGDTINLNMVITPWGHYNSTTDTSMQNIRENTCLDPLSVDVIKGEKIESTYIPKVLSSDGKSAEFTLSGGTSNVVARVYGFEKLTAPKIYEKIDGEWVEYITSSVNTPDKMGNRHYYDGYYAYYDGDGKYSYAFVANMTDANSRTFRIVADEDFKRWPAIDGSDIESPLNVYIPPSILFSVTNGSVKGVGAIELSEDGSYVRYYGDGNGTPEAYFQPYSTTSEIDSGAYVVLKYRMPTSNPENNYFQFFTTTDESTPMANCSLSAGKAYKDGEWHIMVVDIVAKGHKHFADSGDGETYYAKYLRLDVFNVAMSDTSYVDIAYIGMTNDLNKLFELEKNQYNTCSEVRVFGAGESYVAYDLNGNVLSESDGSGSESGPDDPADIVYIDPENEQGYTKSNTAYVSGLDFINGFGDGDPSDPAFNNYRSHQVIGPKVVNFDDATSGNAYLVLAGWTMVYKGVEKFVWSADGGKTWHDIVLYNRKELGSATGEIKDAGDGHFNATVTGFDKNVYNQDYYANSVYQGSYGTPSGIAAHLVDYIGQEVDVTFAAVPKNAPTTLCLIGHITNVRVYESDEAADAGEACKHTDPVGYSFVDDGDPNTYEAKISKTCKCGEVSFNVEVPRYVFYLENIKQVMENSKGYRTINLDELSLKANANGVVTFKGWMGMNGGCSKLVYRVYTSDGTEITSDWIECSTFNLSNAEAAVGAEMTKRGIESKFGKRYSMDIDLSAYFENNSNLTVKLAMVADSAPENSNDIYVFIGELTKVSK